LTTGRAGDSTEIIRDVEDAFAWLRAKGPELLHADTERIAVMGGSAGGYLTFAWLSSSPGIALVSLWGYGDLVGTGIALQSAPRHRLRS
jgi:dipeptidyl aminopeptidase/acylaminoacyl peptidase